MLESKVFLLIAAPHTCIYFNNAPHRLMWNRMVILLSLAINVIMLATWDARANLEDNPVPQNATELPSIYKE